MPGAPAEPEGALAAVVVLAAECAALAWEVLTLDTDPEDAGAAVDGCACCSSDY